MRTRDVWVVAERDGDPPGTPAGVRLATPEGVRLRKSTFEILGEGRQLADQLESSLCCVLVGHQLDGLAKSLGRFGVDTAYVLEHPLLAQYNTDAYTAALTDLIREAPPFLVLMSATPNGQDLALRVAARLKIGLVTDAVMLKLDEQGEVQFVKPTHQDRVYTTITCPSTIPRMATLRPGSASIVGDRLVTPEGVRPRPTPFRQPTVIRREPCIEPSTLRTRTVGLVKGDPRLIELSQAEVIVAGGRGVGGTERWRLVEELAETLGASVAGTRPAMELGCISRDRVVGQTGQTVSPRLYLAAGISGASHHLGGIHAEFMIAINTDRHAPILQHSDLGLVGDLHEILPALTRRLREIKAGSS